MLADGLRQVGKVRIAEVAARVARVRRHEFDRHMTVGGYDGLRGRYRLVDFANQCGETTPEPLLRDVFVHDLSRLFRNRIYAALSLRSCRMTSEASCR